MLLRSICLASGGSSPTAPSAPWAFPTDTAGMLKHDVASAILSAPRVAPLDA